MNQLIEQHCEAILRISEAHGVMDAQELFGRSVDVVLEKALLPSIRERILREALPL